MISDVSKVLLIFKAIDFCKEHHKNQKRRGVEEPYYTHPMEVSIILMASGFPIEVVIAGLLHDVVEDTEVTVEQIKIEFGSRVAELVDNVSNVTDEELINSDYHTQCLKVADIISNVRSLSTQPDKDFANRYFNKKVNQIAKLGKATLLLKKISRTIFLNTGSKLGIVKGDLG